MCDCFEHGLEAHTGSRLTRRVVIGSLACLAIAPKVSVAQAQQFSHLLAGACNFYPGATVSANAYSFGSNAEAQSVVSRITSSTGLKPNFEVIADNVPNAAAVIQNGIRYILYNTTFIDQITQQTGSEWASWTIMAHEVGHHLNGHTLQRGGSRPPTELEADEFAGFAVQKIGGTLDQALSPYQTMGTAGSSTHPPRADRLAAVTAGWQAAAGNGGSATVPSPASVPPPVANPQDMLIAIITSLMSGITPPFPMEPTLKAAYDAQASVIAMQLGSMGSLIGLSPSNSPRSTANGTFYDYRSTFSAGQAFWRIGVAENGVITGLWVSGNPLNPL